MLVLMLMMLLQDCSLSFRWRTLLLLIVDRIHRGLLVHYRVMSVLLIITRTFPDRKIPTPVMMFRCVSRCNIIHGKTFSYCSFVIVTGCYFFQTKKSHLIKKNFDKLLFLFSYVFTCHVTISFIFYFILKKNSEGRNNHLVQYVLSEQGGMMMTTSASTMSYTYRIGGKKQINRKHSAESSVLRSLFDLRKRMRCNHKNSNTNCSNNDEPAHLQSQSPPFCELTFWNCRHWTRRTVQSLQKLVVRD